jgi:hypothetical protein
LHIASSEGQNAIVKYLVTRGADPDLKDQWGRRAIEDAERQGHSVIVTFLRLRTTKEAKKDEPYQSNDEEYQQPNFKTQRRYSNAVLQRISLPRREFDLVNQEKLLLPKIVSKLPTVSSVNKKRVKRIALTDEEAKEKLKLVSDGSTSTIAPENATKDTLAAIAASPLGIPADIPDTFTAEPINFPKDDTLPNEPLLPLAEKIETNKVVDEIAESNKSPGSNLSLSNARSRRKLNIHPGIIKDDYRSSLEQISKSVKSLADKLLEKYDVEEVEEKAKSAPGSKRSLTSLPSGVPSKKVDNSKDESPKQSANVEEDHIHRDDQNIKEEPKELSQRTSKNNLADSKSIIADTKVDSQLTSRNTLKETVVSRQASKNNLREIVTSRQASRYNLEESTISRKASKIILTESARSQKASNINLAEPADSRRASNINLVEPAFSRQVSTNNLAETEDVTSQRASKSQRFKESKKNLADDEADVFKQASKSKLVKSVSQGSVAMGSLKGSRRASKSELPVSSLKSSKGSLGSVKVSGQSKRALVTWEDAALKLPQMPIKEPEEVNEGTRESSIPNLPEIQ